MPDLSTAVLLEMLRVAGEARVDAVALQDGERFRPLPSLVRVAPARDAARRAARTRGSDRSARCCRRSATAVIDEPTWTALDPSRGTLIDVDEPDDLDRWRSPSGVGRTGRPTGPQRVGVVSGAKSGEAEPPAHHTLFRKDGRP